jgi:HAMP domain
MNRTHTIAAKLIVGLVTLMLVFLTIYTLEYFQDVRSIERRYDNNLNTLTQFLKRPTEDFLFTGNEKNLAQLAQAIIGNGIIAAIAVRDSKGLLMAEWPASPNRALPEKEIALYRSFTEGDLSLFDGVPQDSASQSVQSEQNHLLGTLIISLDHSDKETAFSQLTRHFVIVILLTLLSAWLCIYFTLKKIAMPLKTIQSAMLSIKNGHYDSRISNTQDDEIGQLSTLVNDVAKELHGKKMKQQDQMREITKAHLEMTKSHIEKNTLMDKLLEGIIPSLQVAMETLDLLHDKPAIQKNLTHSIIAALSLTEETRDLVSSHANQLIVCPEKMKFGDMVQRIKEFVTYLAESKSVNIPLEVDIKGELLNHYVVIDRVLFARLLTHIFEFINAKMSESIQVKRFWMIFDSTDTDKITVNFILRIANSHLSPVFIHAINSYFESDGKENAAAQLRTIYTYLVNDNKSANYGVHLHTIFSFKKIIDAMSSRYALISDDKHEVLHTFSCSVPCAASLQALDDLLPERRQKHRQKLCIVGDVQFLRNIRGNLLGADHHISFDSFDTAERSPLSTETHYLIDCITDSDRGLDFSKRVIALNSTTHNVAAAISSQNFRDAPFDYGHDLSFDLFVCEPIRQQDIQKICNKKRIRERNTEVEKIIQKLKLDLNTL